MDNGLAKITDNALPPEPLWRTTLCWGSVVLYLTLPVIILTVRLLSDHFPEYHWAESLSQAKFMIPYFTSLTALVFGLAGLSSWDRKNGKLNHKPEEKKEPVKSPEPESGKPPERGPRATE